MREPVDLAEVLGSFASLTVVVFGDFCLDAYWQLDEGDPELSVETGLPVNRVRSSRYSLGASGNVCTVLRNLGVSNVKAVGPIGDDLFGAQMLREMDRQGVDRSGLLAVAEPWQTMVYVKPYLAAVEQSRFDFGGFEPLPEGTHEHLLAALESALVTADALVINEQFVSDLYSPELLSGLGDLMAKFPEKTYVVDSRNLGVPFPKAVLKLNCREATSLSSAEPKEILTDEEAERLAQRVADEHTTTVYLTRGDRGIAVGVKGQATLVLPIENPTPEVDAVGAGDVVTAVITAGHAAGLDPVTVGELANMGATVSVRSVGSTGAEDISQESLAEVAGDNVIYAATLADSPHQARFIEGTEFELVVPSLVADRRKFTDVIFDHDGTLSTLREGWELLMHPMMVEAILGEAATEIGPDTLSTINREVDELIDRTTGIQTLLQMRELIALVRKWGFVPSAQVLDEHGYKAIYNATLLNQVNDRIDKLDKGQLDPEDFHIKNARPLLQALTDAGLRLHLASGTDEADVIAEANKLGFGEFFEDRIHGSIGVVTHDAKQMVMETIVEDGGLDGSSLLTFGDGPVELRETRKRGGTAVGLVSDELRRHGINPAKRRRLIRGGAHLLVGDYSDLDTLLHVLHLD